MNQSEVWMIKLDPTVGQEINKIRPAVVVNDTTVGHLDLRVIVPLTAWNDRYAVALWMVRIEPNSENGLAKTSSADAFQVRSVSTQRFERRLGILSQNEMSQIKRALAAVIDIYLPPNYPI